MRHRTGIARWSWLVLVGSTVGCLDDFSGGVDGAADFTYGASDAGAPSVAGPGSSPMRRLTRTEYDNTVRDLLGDATHPARAFIADKRIGGFDNNVDGLAVSPLNVDHFIGAAASLAEAAVAGGVTPLLGCDPATLGEAPCVRAFIERFGLRAHRRPLVASEIDGYVALYDAAKDSALGGENPTAIGLRQILQTMLLSADFLYRVEPRDSSDGSDGSDGDVVPVTGMMMASRLSYLLWSSMPDDALFAAAKSGKLSTLDEIEAQARRMLADSKAKSGLENFLSQWFQIYKLDYADKSAARYPEFTPAIVSDLKEEARLFFEESLWEDASAKNLLTAEFTFVNPELASYYGLALPSGNGFQKVSTASTGRQGALTLGAVMAALASDVTDPIQRGKMVTENLLCQTIPAAPPGLAANAPALDPTKDNRTRLSVIQDNPSCAGCHHMMERVGFGFENFSAIGKWQASDPNTPLAPIDATGEIIAGDAKGNFNGAVELSTKIAGSTDYMNCMAQKLYQFGIGRSHEPSDDDALAEIAANFSARGYDVKELLVAYVRSTPFRFRKAGAQ